MATQSGTYTDKIKANTKPIGLAAAVVLLVGVAAAIGGFYFGKSKCDDCSKSGVHTAEHELVKHLNEQIDSTEANLEKNYVFNLIDCWNEFAKKENNKKHVEKLTSAHANIHKINEYALKNNNQTLENLRGKTSRSEDEEKRYQSISKAILAQIPDDVAKQSCPKLDSNGRKIETTADGKEYVFSDNGDKLIPDGNEPFVQNLKYSSSLSQRAPVRRTQPAPVRRTQPAPSRRTYPAPASNQGQLRARSGVPPGSMPRGNANLNVSTPSKVPKYPAEKTLTGLQQNGVSRFEFPWK
jgi:hypothetical protein